MKSLTTIVGVLLTAAAALPASAQVRAAPQTQPSAPGTVVVIASVEAFWSADQYAKTAGYVAEVKHDLGDHVAKGELLAVLHVPELEKNLVQAKATLIAKQQMRKAAEAAVAQARQALAVAKSQLAASQAERDLQQLTLKRQEELSAGKATTPQQLDEIRSKAKVSEANVTTGEAKAGSAEADIQAAEANRDVAAAQADVADAAVQEVEALLEYTKITAPFDGIITRRQVNPGDLVQGATTTRTMPLFTVQQLDTVRVFCDVPEAQAAGVAAGAEAEIKLYGLGGQVIKGKVTRIAHAIDALSRTMRAEIDLPNPQGSLRPGMYAQVTIALHEPPRIADASPSN
jgi:multidrug resistance efflux pump